MRRKSKSEDACRKAEDKTFLKMPARRGLRSFRRAAPRSRRREQRVPPLRLVEVCARRGVRWPRPTRFPAPGEHRHRRQVAGGSCQLVVWDRYVRRELEKRDWLVADFQQQPGHRRDFLGYWNGGWSVLAARVAGTNAHPDPLEATRRRLAEFAHRELVAGRRIVIPDIRAAAGEDLDVKVLRLGELLDEPTRAFDSSFAAAT